MFALHRPAKTLALGTLFCLDLAACAAPDEAGDDVMPDPIVMDEAELAEYAALAPVADPVVLTEPELAHVLELRRHYGLSTDPDLVRTLHEQPGDFAVVRSSKMLFGGLLLDESEVPIALERAEVEYRGSDADDWAREELGARYAGSFFEGTKVILQCAGCDPSEVTRSLAGQRGVHEFLRGRVEVRPVERSLVDLTAMEARLAGTLRERGIEAGSSVDVAENHVDLYAGPGEAAWLERELGALEQVTGGPIELIVSESEPEQLLYKNEALPYALVEGGQYIHNGYDACTSGFAVQGYYGPFMLTAAHCAAINQTWYQGGAVLGQVALSEDGARMDVAAITTWGRRNNWGRIHVDYYNDRAPVTFVAPDGHILFKTVCNSGATSTCLSGLCGTSTTRCGVMMSETMRPFSWHQPVWGYAVFKGQQGDSGGGVYWPTGYGAGAVGIVSGLRDGVYFSRMSVVLGAFGMSLSPY